MTNPPEKSGSSRDTFLSIQECLEQSAASCREAARGVESCLGDVDSPYREGLQEMVETEAELAEVLSNFADHGPASLLNTRLQFTFHLPDEVSAGASASSALKHLQAINEQAVMNLREQVSQSVPPGSAEHWDTLWREVEALARRISTIHVTMRDV